MFAARLVSFLLLSCSLLFSLASAQTSSSSADSVGTFNPYLYRKTFVTCPAVDRRNPAAPKPLRLRLAYLDINPTATKSLILVHGWPSLWTTYRHQITEFAKEYRIILPEHRGYGDSQHPADLESSNTMYDFVDDMLCMLDHAGVHSGVCVGNDFGAQVCWEAGRSRPDRFIGVFNIGIPYVSAAIGFTPNRDLAALNPFFGYQVYLDERPRQAAAEMDADVRMAIRSCARTKDAAPPPTFLTRNDTFLGPWRAHLREAGLRQIPASGIMSRVVEDYMVMAYRKQGFYNTFNGYQTGNRNLTFQFEVNQGNFTLSQPTFTLFMTHDPVADWEDFAGQIGSSSFLENHYNQTISTAHWPHEESPVEFNAILRQWLGNVTFSE